jgi:hypothetical protein
MTFRAVKRERGVSGEFDLWVVEGPGSPQADWGVYFNEQAAEGAAGRLKRAFELGRRAGVDEGRTDAEMRRG